MRSPTNSYTFYLKSQGVTIISFVIIFLYIFFWDLIYLTHAKMGMKDALKTLSGKINSKAIGKLTAEFPDNVTTKDNVIKTDDLRIDLHKNVQYPDWAIARIQANTKAKDPGVKDFIKKGNKGSGSHSGTHKNIAEIQFDRTNLDAEAFKAQVMEAYRATQVDDDNGEGSSNSKRGH